MMVMVMEMVMEIAFINTNHPRLKHLLPYMDDFGDGDGDVHAYHRCLLNHIHLQIVILKLKQRTAMDHDRRHWKATKALIFVMPLLGFG